MALTEEIVQDKIEIVGDFKMVQVRTATVIKRDGVEISRSFHRHVVAPDANITGESAEVQAICNAAHTQAIKDAYAAHIAAQTPEE
jgi:phage host-nuclease inhibitor protein Gam